MTLAHRRGLLGMVLVLTAVFVVLGCNQNENKGGDKVAKAKTGCAASCNYFGSSPEFVGRIGHEAVLVEGTGLSYR